jgi:hypothetical protein
MAKTKSNEWNFTSNVAAEMSRLLALPDFAGSDLGRAEAERTLTGEAKRLDLVFFDRNDREKAIVTGELKAPWTKEGKTPFDSNLVEGDLLCELRRSGVAESGRSRWAYFPCRKRGTELQLTLLLYTFWSRRFFEARFSK